MSKLSSFPKFTSGTLANFQKNCLSSPLDYLEKAEYYLPIDKSYSMYPWTGQPKVVIDNHK